MEIMFKEDDICIIIGKMLQNLLKIIFNIIDKKVISIIDINNFLQFIKF